MPATTGGWLLLWLLLCGCVSPAILPYKRPLQVPAHAAHSLTCKGSWPWHYTVDINDDGRDDLLLVGRQAVMLFLDNGVSLPTRPDRQMALPHPILGFALSRSLLHRPWLVLLTSHDVSLWDIVAGEQLQCVRDWASTPLAYFPCGRLPLFHDLDRNGFDELFVPQRDDQGWRAHIYVWRGNFVDSGAVLPLGYAGSSLPPYFYSWPQAGRCEIWVEQARGLAVHTLASDDLSTAAPAAMVYWPGNDEASADAVSPLAVGQLNDGPADMVVGSPGASRMWMIVDRARSVPLELPDVVPLGATFCDIDGDGREDVAALAIPKPTLGESLWSYFTSGHLPVRLGIYVFANRHGNIGSRPSLVKYKDMWLPYANRHQQRQQNVALVCEDLDHDGLLDGAYLDAKGCLRLWYNLYRESPSSHPHDRWDDLLLPVYRQLARVYKPMRRPDVVLQLPPADGYWQVDASPLRCHPQDDGLLFHYRALPWEDDLLVTVTRK